MRTDEYPIFNSHAVIYRNVILDLDMVSDVNPGININSPAENAFLAKPHTCTNLALVPDLSTITNMSQFRHL
jgi:hypothetical protein